MVVDWFSPSPLIPLPSRERGFMVGLDLVTRVTPRPVVSRLRGNDGEGDLRNCDDALIVLWVLP